MKQRKLWASVMMLASLLLLLVGCTTKPTTKHNGITVVSSLNFYGEVAKAVLGDHGTVTSIITNPNTDPHDFEPTTKTARTVAAADVIIANGVGYDAWMQKLVNANGNSKVTDLRVGEDLMGKKNGANEHLWYNQATMPKLARHLAKVYARRDPKHKADYQRNAAKYIKSLHPITTKLARLKQNSRQQHVAVSEPVFNYALAELDYKISDQHFARAIEEGTDPSPSDIRKLQTAITQHQIAFFVQNSQSTDKVIANLVNLAHKHNVPVIKVTETMPHGQNYRQWMLSQYEQLAKIQQAKS
ncbi:metal ABC transporter solute-binding protein [Loigolactobacillus binensis]|uniref:Metal ABC transporter solute-binding protein n=1 Tax=Loigolactobacillus binensis TaxID=2559922 RepID=A0ABW3ECK7_9LACO|nr:metal ABC transporter solute-binding protein [Loigolactobacillus binensis]